MPSAHPPPGSHASSTASHRPDAHGRLRDRRLESSEHSTQLPHAPPGEYVVLVYAADYEAGPHREQLVMQRERDGEWRALGYWVRP